MRLPDRGGAAAKRQGRGFSGCVRRHGFADGIRPTRLGYAALKGDDDISDIVYADVDFAVDHGDPEHRGRIEFDFGTAFGEDCACAESDADTGWSGASARAGEFGSDAASPGEEIVIATRPRNAEVAELADALA